MLLPLLMFMLLPASLHCNPNQGGSFADIATQISGYKDVALKIIDLAINGKAQNRSYERLAVFTDTVGNRISGSKNLDLAIKYMHNALIQDGLENVHLEPAKIPHWVRGHESAVMVLPRNHTMAILGLGSSVGTPSQGKKKLIF